MKVGDEQFCPFNVVVSVKHTFVIRKGVNTLQIVHDSDYLELNSSN